MKRIFAAIIAVLTVLSLASCGKEETHETEATDSETTGVSSTAESTSSVEKTQNTEIYGEDITTTAPRTTQPELKLVWSVSEASGAPLNENIRSAFLTATETASGNSPQPVLCLGSQVVSGYNYAVLCKKNEGDKTALKVYIIYAPFNGNAEITNISDFDINRFTDSRTEEDRGPIAGGWGVYSEYGEYELPDRVASVFSSSGATGRPVALLGSDNSTPARYAVIVLKDSKLFVDVISESGLIRETEINAALFAR
jgi:hypothetical protein